MSLEDEIAKEAVSSLKALLRSHGFTSFDWLANTSNGYELHSLIGRYCGSGLSACSERFVGQAMFAELVRLARIGIAYEDKKGTNSETILSSCGCRRCRPL
jgi:hypothetical protein